jgi:hypothetical protein
MDEMLVQLLLGLVELFFDVLLEFAGELILGLLSRAAADVFKTAVPPHPVRNFFACGFLGVWAGTASLAICLHPLFHSLQNSRHQPDHKSGSYWFGDVRLWGYAAQARQASSSDQKLSIRICFRVWYCSGSIGLRVLTLPV